MAEESGLERTEQPTSRRLERAREEGDVPRSREMATCLILLAAGTSLWMTGGAVVNQISMMLTNFFFFKQKTAYEITERDWSSDVCSSDLMRIQRDFRRQSR